MGRYYSVSHSTAKSMSVTGQHSKGVDRSHCNTTKGQVSHGHAAANGQQLLTVFSDRRDQRKGTTLARLRTVQPARLYFESSVSRLVRRG